MAIIERRNQQNSLTKWDIFRYALLPELTSRVSGRTVLRGTIALGAASLAVAIADPPHPYIRTVSAAELAALNNPLLALNAIGLNEETDPTDAALDKQTQTLDDGLPVVDQQPQTPIIDVISTPPPTLVPAPALFLDPLSFKIDNGVSQIDIDAIKDGAWDGYRYVTGVLDFQFGAPIIVHIRTNPSPDGYAYISSDENSYLPQLIVSDSNWASKSRLSKMTITAHEVAGHPIQLDWINGRNRPVPRAIPMWSWEGFAQYIAEMSQLDRKGWTHDQMLECYKFVVTRPQPVASLEIRDPDPAKNGIQNYSLGLLAIDYLVQRYGIGAVKDFFVLTTVEDPPVAFGRVFGDLSQFYFDFENYRYTFDNTPRNSTCIQ